MRWADYDYAITEVSYDDDHSEIDEVKRREVEERDSDYYLVSPANRGRSEIIDAIDSGAAYCTSTRNEDTGNWGIGEDVRVREMDGEEYIRTDNNDTKSDNLGSLPEF